MDLLELNLGSCLKSLVFFFRLSDVTEERFWENKVKKGLEPFKETFIRWLGFFDEFRVVEFWQRVKF